MEIKFDIYFKQKAGTLFKSNEFVTHGIVANTNINLNEVEKMQIAYLVDNEFYEDDIYIVDVENRLIEIPFKSTVLKAGTHEFEIKAYMKDDSIKVSQTYIYNIEKGLLEGTSNGAGHIHANKLVLDSITSDDINNWNNKATREDIKEEIKNIDISQGPQGPKGETGERGPQGIQGPKGDTGATGPQGERGLQGEVGPQGPRGEQGIQGLVGPQGERGLQGPKGDTGATGPQGPKGDKGDRGITPNINIGTVNTLPAGSNATVTKTGTNENPVFNFGIPRGFDGTGEGGSGLNIRDVQEGEIFEVEIPRNDIPDEEIPPINIYGDIVVSTTSISLNKSTTQTFTVKLDKAPTANQVVTLSVNNGNATINKTSLTFTPQNYNTTQSVTINGVNVGSSVITLSSPNVTSKTINVTVTEAQTEPSGQKDIILTDAINYKNRVGTYFSMAIKLSERLEGEVTINLNGLDDCVVNFDPSIITFNSSNYNIAKKVSVRPKNTISGIVELSGDGIKAKRVTFDRTSSYSYENLTEEERRTLITENEGYIKIPVHQLTIDEVDSYSTGEYILFSFVDFKNTNSALYGLFSETATTFTELIKESNNFPIISSTNDNATGFHFTNAKNVSFKIKRELLVDSNVYKYIEDNYGKIFTIKLNDNVKKITINPDQLTNYRTRNLDDSKLQYCFFDYNSGLDTNYTKGIGSLNMRFNSRYCWSEPYENVKVTTNSFEMLLYDRINSDSLTGQDYIDFLKSNPLTIWCV